MNTHPCYDEALNIYDDAVWNTAVAWTAYFDANHERTLAWRQHPVASQEVDGAELAYNVAKNKYDAAARKGKEAREVLLRALHIKGEL